MRNKIIGTVKGLLAWISLLLIMWVSSAYVTTLNRDFTFKYVMVDSDGAHIAGQTPTLHILKMATGQYYDFTADTFVSSVNTTTSWALTELASAYYLYTWNPPSSETTGQEYTFLVKNPGTYADIQYEEVTYLNIEDLSQIEADIATANAHLVGIKGGGWTNEDLVALDGKLQTNANNLYDMQGTGWTDENLTTMDALLDSIAVHLTDIKGGSWSDETLVALMVEAELIYTHTSLMSGSTFWSATDSLEAIRNRGDAAWLSCSGDEFVGTGDTAVDEDYGGDDALAYTTAGGAGIDNATVVAYLASDYTARNWGYAYVKGVTKTDTSGYWEKDLQLDCGYEYTIKFYKQGYYGPDTEDVTVTCP